MAAHAQRPDRIPRVAVWTASAESDPQSQQRTIYFREALRQLAWLDDRNIRIEYGWRIGINAEQIRAEATALIASNPHVTVSTGASVLAALHT